MKKKFAEFMNGRYGTDDLSKFMLGICVAFLILGMFFRSQFLNLMVLILLGVCYFRMFSKNYAQRSGENRKYLDATWKVRSRFEKVKNRAVQSKDYHIYKCPSCGQKIRIPRGKGKICITCPKCKHEFEKKS